MKYIFIAILVLMLLSAAYAQTLSITAPKRNVLLEGSLYQIKWGSSGINKVSVIARGILTPLGIIPRGVIDIVIADSVPAEQGYVQWVLPWLDTKDLNIKVIGYDLNGKEAASDSRVYGFRPAVLAKRFKDGIYLDLHKRENQRLYVQRGGRIIHEYISSSSMNYYWLPPNVHINKPHDHAGVFRVLDKTPMHWSTLFRVEMPWALRYLGGHYIHATPVKNYAYLGEPASSGCNRLTYEDAYQLYHSTPVGTRVEIIGAKG